MVTTQAALAEMIDHLADSGAFAFDSEFIGERSYISQLCLVQVATAQHVFLVDPQADIDLAPFWAQIVSPASEKLLLAGQQDLEPAARHTGLAPANIMDLQIAAGFVHVDYPLSLTRLLEEFIGVSLGKAHSFSNWERRPLTPVQIRYASDDVRYLLAAREVVGKRLTETKRLAWAKEECAATLEDMTLYRPAPETLFLRVRTRDPLRPRQRAVLRELAIVRDQAARAENVPPRTLLPDGLLITMARRPVGNVTELDGIRGLPRPVETRYGQQIVEATARALALPENALPPEEPVETATLRNQADRVFDEICRHSQERSVAPALVASRREIVRLCHAVSKGQPVDQHRLYRGWRKQLLGGLLERLL